jgi:hypothetical protein
LLPAFGIAFGVAFGVGRGGIAAGVTGAIGGVCGVTTSGVGVACSTTGTSAAAGFLAAAFLAGAFLTGFSAAAGFTAGGYFSRNLRTTGGSTVDDAERTNSPISWSFARTSLLSIPKSFANS